METVNTIKANNTEYALQDAETSGKVSSLETEVNSLSGEVTGTSGKVSSLETEVNSLSGEVTETSGKVSSLETEVNSLSGEVTETSGKVSSLETEVNSLSGEVTETSGKVSSLEKEVDELNQSLADYLKVQSFTSEVYSVGIDSNVTASIDISLDGYTPLGIVTWNNVGSQTSNLNVYGITMNSAKTSISYSVRNFGSVAISSFTAKITVLYMKNI